MFHNTNQQGMVRRESQKENKLHDDMDAWVKNSRVVNMPIKVKIMRG
jgi:hypothetical protein